MQIERDKAKAEKKKATRAHRKFFRKLELSTAPGDCFFQTSTKLYILAVRSWDAEGLSLIQQENVLKRQESGIVHHAPKVERKSFLAELRGIQKQVRERMIAILLKPVEYSEDPSTPRFALGWCVPASLMKSFTLLATLSNADSSHASAQEQQAFAKLNNDFAQEIQTLYTTRPIFMKTLMGSEVGDKIV